MGFLDNLTKRFAGEKVTVVPSVTEYFTTKNKAVINGYNQSIETSSSVYTSISIIANTVGKLPIGIYRKKSNGSKELYTDHKWFNALRYSPDGRLSSSKFISYLLTKMYLEGNSFFYVDQVNKKFVALDELQKAVPYEGEIWYKFKNVDTYLPSKSLVHNYLISKDGGISGLNPIDAIRTELQIQSGGENALKNYYENGLMSTLYLEADLEGASATDKTKAAEYFKKLETDFQGFQNSGKIPRIPPMYKLKSLPQGQIDFLTNSKYTISQIAALFQVPSFYLGVQDGSTSYGKAEEQQIAFKNICISNVCSILKNELEAKLLTVDERNAGVSIDFDFKNLFDVDLTTKSNVLKTLHQVGALSPNEIREEFNYPMIENDNMNAHYLQAQYKQVENYVNEVPNNLTINNN